MHHLFSNGIVAQELGLWYSLAHREAGVTVQHMCQYMQLAWSPLKGGQLEAPRADLHFTSKMWRLDQDFRGDAQACLDVLPLCVAYGEDMLRGRYDNLEKALESLRALHSVVICLKKMQSQYHGCGPFVAVATRACASIC